MPDDRSIEKESSSRRRDLFEESLRWYLGGTFLVGVAAGLLSGMSASPVVGILLPLIFGLLGGGAGLYLAAIDITKAAARQKIKLLGMVITTLLLALIPSALYGILVRTGASVRSLLPGAAAPASPEMEIAAGTDPIQPLELLLLRRKLQLLGATSGEQQKIVALAAKSSAGSAPRKAW